MNNLHQDNSVVAIDLISHLVENSVENFKNLISSNELTEFDKLIFGQQINCIRNGSPIQFETVVEANFRKIRATRLRVLGYKWNRFESYWEI